MIRSGAVVLFGDLNVDYMLPIEEFPQPGYEGIADRAYLRPGGSIANTACLLAQLSVPTRLVSKTGRDPWAEYELDALRKAGVDISAVKQEHDQLTGVSVIVVQPGGERTMFSHRGANALLRQDELDEEALAGACWLHISGYAFMQSPQREAAWWLMRRARESNLPISIDTGLQSVLAAPEEARRAVAQADLVVLGPAEADAMFGAMPAEAVLDRLLADGARVAALKLAGRGSWLAARDGRLFLPAIPVAAIDATGAGDAYSAGLIFGQLSGASTAACGLLATLFGGLATTVWGAGPDLPGPRQALDYLQANRSMLTGGAWPDAYDEVLGYLLAAAESQPMRGSA